FVQGSFAQNQDTSTSKLQSIFNSYMQLRHQNKVDQALNTLDEAANIAESNEDTKLLLDVYHQYARMFLEAGDRKTALFYWDRANILLRYTSYSFGMAFHLYLEAAIRFDEGNNFQALKLLEESKKLSNNRNLGNNALLLEAYIQTNITNYDKAIKNLNALNVNSDDKERDYLATKANLQIAKISVVQGDLEDAIIHSKATLELAQKYGYSAEIRNAFEQLADIYEMQGAFAEALFYTRNLEKIKDSVFNLGKAKLETSTADKIRFEHQINE